MIHNTEDQNLTEMVQRIVASASPEKIYLVAAGYSRQCQQSVFSAQPVVADYSTGYLFLVLIDPSKGHATHAVYEKIDKIASWHIPACSWVMHETQFEKMLLAGEHFACRILEQAPLLYSSKPDTLSLPHSLQPVQEIQTSAAAFAGRAIALLAGVDLYILRKEYAMAALLLHQSAEQLFTAIIYSATGFRPQTHNIERLYQYARFFHQPLVTAWPMHTQDNKNQLQHLNKAYLESRYGNYSIKEGDLRSIASKLQQLHPVAVAC